MSDSLPKPLSSINALRAHLKLLERGVNSARERRVGPPPAAVRPAAPMSPRPVQSQSAPASYPMAGRAAAQSAGDGKPKAKAKSAGDFSEFFENIQKRAAS